MLKTGRSRTWLLFGLAAILVALLSMALILGSDRKVHGPVVMAAASLQPAMEAAAADWASQGHARPVLSFAASSALARQIEAGAPVDLYISADEDWANYLEKRNLVQPGTRVTLLGNRLVLIGARDDMHSVTIRRGFPIRALLGAGRLAIADPDGVPAGKYAKAALTWAGVWGDVANHLAPADNVRATLMLVERRQAPLGIVYATDVAASDKVRELGAFPEASHPPIRYPLMRIATSRNPEAEPFRRFLMSAEAAAIFRRFGFSVR